MKSISILEINSTDESKKYSKNQESIQSSTTPDPEYHMGKRQNKQCVLFKINMIPPVLMRCEVKTCMHLLTRLYKQNLYLRSRNYT